tara:strand:+ start:1445 stop:2572 length:1128 start_codon:yes stop_codon:yes gene_type:complete
MRNNILILISIFLIAVIFFYGFSVGMYKIFPYEFLDSSSDALSGQKAIESNQFLNQADIDSLIKIDNKSDIDQKRNFLTEFFWDVGSLQRVIDKSPLPQVEYDISDSRYSDFQNLNRIDKLTVEMEYGINSISYLFIPKVSNEKLILYHQGHGGDFILGQETIQFFLNRDFTVLASTMPLVGMNNQPIVEIDGFGKIKLISHEQLNLLKTNGFNPMRLFIDPIQINLTFLHKEYAFQQYSMIGISGGGWTTVIYSAIDERISDSFSVAGSMPFYLRVNDRDIGDYEQTNTDLYQNVNYLEFYVLSGYGEGRKHIQIFNENDPCCFSGNGYETYEFITKDKISQLGNGDFQVFVDNTHNEHKISDTALEYIIKNIG